MSYYMYTEVLDSPGLDLLGINVIGVNVHRGPRYSRTRYIGYQCDRSKCTQKS